MNFSIEREELLKVLGVVQKALPTSSTIPILEYVLFESTGSELVLTATNLEVGIRGKIPFDSENTVRVLLPKKIVPIISSLDGSHVELSISENRIGVVGGSAKFDLAGVSPEDYPVIEEQELGDDAFTIGQGTLKKALKRVLFAVSTDATRLAFQGVLFTFGEQFSMVASDTYRLARLFIPGEKWNHGDPKYLIPGKSLKGLVSILGDDDEKVVKIYPVGKKLVFMVGSFCFSTHLLSEFFPDVDGVIPDSSATRVKVSREAFRDVIVRATLLVDEVNRSVKLSIKNDKLNVGMESGLGELQEELEIEKEGEDIELYLNPYFLLDMLKNVDSENVSINLNQATDPIVFRVDDQDYLYLVLPVKKF